MLSSFLIVLAVVVAIPALTLGLECLAALLPLRRNCNGSDCPRPTLAVLVPAHNEELGIAATVDAVRRQLAECDRLIVIADNCSDGTAANAQAAGAAVVVRTNAELRGKGHALQFGIESLRSNPPQVVICIDADCIPGMDCLDQIARFAWKSSAPVQAANISYAPAGSNAHSAISEFAVLVKNYVRPRGLQRLGLPCLVTGTGTAYPWQAIESARWPDGHIAEDMQYGIELAQLGRFTKPCVEVQVRSALPTAKDASVTQRTRWEHGHISVMRSAIPALVSSFARRRHPFAITLALEVGVPPLSMFIPLLILSGGMFAAYGLMAEDWIALSIWAVGSTVAAAGLVASWFAFGRTVLPLEVVRSIPQYMLGKAPIYIRFFTSPQKSWVRTSRMDIEPQLPVRPPRRNKRSSVQVE